MMKRHCGAAWRTRQTLSMILNLKVRHSFVLRVLRATTLVWLSAAGACARVAPYERETLARRDMALAGSGEVMAGEEHGRAYREGSSGGGAAKGGGCGCN